MAQLSTKIKLYANKEIDFSKDVLLQDDSNGKGAYIKEWNLSIAEPTDVQLASYETAGNTEELLKANLAKRVYPSIGDQLDMQYWDKVNGTTTWKDAVAQVKSDNPKD